VAAAVAVVLGLVAGCGGSVPASVAPTAQTEEPPTVASLAVSPTLELIAQHLPPEATDLETTADATEPSACEPGTIRRMRTDTKAYAAVAKHRTAAFARPNGKRLALFERKNQNDYPTVFGVLSAVLGADCKAIWYHVQLPLKPNGSTGYVRASAVELATVKTRIRIDLSERRLELFAAGKRILEAPVAIGATITPTPPGKYYVNQRLVAPDPWGPFGPAAIGISGFSPVLQDWVQGGPLAIHGTNDPASIGTAASHGCVRVKNDVLQLLFRKVPAGTPVVISA